ncbi:MAG: prenyltransferase [Natronomonas sp.]
MSENALDRALPSEDTPIGYLLRLSRPRFWMYLAGPVIVGVAYAATTVEELFAPIGIALFLYFVLPANFLLYGINDVFDVEIDEANPKKEEREIRYHGDRLVPVVVIASALIGLGFLPFLPGAGIAAMVLFLFLAVQYSAPPFRFKTTPFLDSASNGLYILPGVVAYAAIEGAAPPLAAIVGGWLWAMGMHTFSAIPDIEPDREAGIKTTATVLGKMPTYGYCGVCWIVAAAVFFTAHPYFLAVFGIYPLFVAGIATSNISVDRAYWWFPALNTVAGMILTLGALWVMLYA